MGVHRNNSGLHSKGFFFFSLFLKKSSIKDDRTDIICLPFQYLIIDNDWRVLMISDVAKPVISPISWIEREEAPLCS